MDVRYAIRPSGVIGFEVRNYDRDLPLTVDPILDYSSFIGGTGDDQATAVVTDGSNTYIVGTTNSASFPSSGTARIAGGADVFITRLDSARANAVTTYIGGSGDDHPNGAALVNGRLAITGETTSRNFPMPPATTGILPLQAAYGGGRVTAFSSISTCVRAL